jgi:hypothetical protein
MALQIINANDTMVPAVESLQFEAHGLTGVAIRSMAVRMRVAAALPEWRWLASAVERWRFKRAHARLRETLLLSETLERAMSVAHLCGADGPLVVQPAQVLTAEDVRNFIDERKSA